GERGSYQLPITITGSGTNFSSATSTVVKISQATSTIVDLQITSVTSVNPQSVDLNVRIPYNAPLGSYTVSVYDQTTGGMISLPNGFSVLANSQPPVAVKTTPAKVALNQTLPITITVDNSNFSQATDNTIYLTAQGTSTLLSPVAGTIVAPNGTHMRAAFNFSNSLLSIGDVLNSHCGNSFDGMVTDFSSITITAPTTIVGTINYSGSFNGVVELYQENPGTTTASPTTYSLVASSAVSSNSYSFQGVAEASYYIRAVPINMTDVVATYYAADISWQTATLVTTSGTVSVCDITPVSSLSLGNGVTVNGTLGYGPNGYNKAQIVLAEGVEVFLKDVSNNLFAQTVTDQNGEYSFSGIPNGNYDIVIDLPGFDQVSTYSFAVTGTSSNLSGLDFVIDNGEIFISNFLGIDDLEAAKMVVYPNPTSGELSIQLPNIVTNAKLIVFNTMGQIVHESTPVVNSNKVIKTDVSSLSEGVYIVRLQGDQFSSETRLVKTK
ncbi:MAG: T9SS type A sorting domain-containing protein, partial [Bacteroidota bacterium]